MDFYNLKPGSRFKAQILDMRPGKITMKLTGGGTLTARSKVMPNAYIGDITVFGVKSNNFKGQIHLEVLDMAADDLQESDDAGSGGGSATTADKQEFLEREGLTGGSGTSPGGGSPGGTSPGETSSGGTSSENIKNMENLEKVLDPSFHLRFMLKKFIDKILRLPNSPAKNLMIETILGEGYTVRQPGGTGNGSGSGNSTGGGAATSAGGTGTGSTAGGGADLSELLYQALVFKFKPGAPASSLKDYFNGLRAKIDKMLEITAGEIAAEARGIKESLDFTSGFKSGLKYYQLPGELPGELFMYPDGSAVLAVDAENLGRVEVTTTGKTASGKTKLEIRVPSKRIMGFLGRNESALRRMLEEAGVDPNGLEISFKTSTERTTVLSKSPYETSGYTVVKHQAFDMRV